MEVNKEPTFKIQFTPEWDEMILEVKDLPPVGVYAQKYLLEEYYFDKFKQYVETLQLEKTKSVTIVAQFKYINRQNERKLESVEFTTNLDDKDIRQWYLNDVVAPILEKIQDVESGKRAIVLHMCFIKFFFENLQPLGPEQKFKLIQIDNTVYEMDDDCNLKFVVEEEEEIPGFRNM